MSLYALEATRESISLLESKYSAHLYFQKLRENASIFIQPIGKRAQKIRAKNSANQPEKESIRCCSRIF